MKDHASTALHGKIKIQFVVNGPPPPPPPQPEPEPALVNEQEGKASEENGGGEEAAQSAALAIGGGVMLAASMGSVGKLVGDDDPLPTLVEAFEGEGEEDKDKETTDAAAATTAAAEDAAVVVAEQGEALTTPLVLEDVADVDKPV